MKTYMQLVEEYAKQVNEVFPWDVENDIPGDKYLLLDIREPYEFSAMRLKDSMNVPRGVLETACEWNYEETVPELVKARDRHVLVVCRSGHRSVLACYMMQLLGFKQVYSLKTGLRGWFEYELDLINNSGEVVDEDTAEDYFSSHVTEEQLAPL